MDVASEHFHCVRFRSTVVVMVCQQLNELCHHCQRHADYMLEVFFHRLPFEKYFSDSSKLLFRVWF